MNRRIMFLVLIATSMVAIPAFSSQCEANYTGSGSMFHGGKTYQTFVDFPALTPAAAMQNLAAQLPGEGFAVERVDEASGTIAASAKFSEGRTGPAEVHVEPIEGGSRVHFSMTLPAGMSGSRDTKTAVCRLVELARVDPSSRYQNELVKFVSVNAKDEAKVALVESDPRKRAGKVMLGALGGALLGAAHAKLTGGDVGKEAVVGALAGGITTFAITKIQDRRSANRDDVMRANSYDPAQGYRTGVRSVSVTPSTIKPGEKITIVTTYWALAPLVSVSFGVRRYAGIALSGSFLKGFRFNPEPFEFGEGGGEYETTIEIGIPPATPPGSYTLHWVVDGQSTGGDGESTFTVSG